MIFLIIVILVLELNDNNEISEKMNYPISYHCKHLHILLNEFTDELKSVVFFSQNDIIHM